MAKFITTITDPVIEEKRQRVYDKMEKDASGKRGQPPMIARLRNFVVLVDYLEREERIPFATARESQMNKAVREWLNERTGKAKKAREKAEKARRAAEEAKGTKDEKNATEEAEAAMRAAEIAEVTSDPRKSRRKQLSPDAVEELLKKIKNLR